MIKLHFGLIMCGQGEEWISEVYEVYLGGCCKTPGLHLEMRMGTGRV